MGQFSDKLVLEHGFENHAVVWTMYLPLTYTANDGRYFEIPAGFKTDLASVPKFLWAIFPPDWSYAKAAVLHDYVLSISTPDVAEELFKEAMESVNVNENQISIMVFFVHLHFRVKTWMSSIKTKKT